MLESANSLVCCIYTSLAPEPVMIVMADAGLEGLRERKELEDW